MEDHNKNSYSAKKINYYVCTCIHKSTSEHQIKGQISGNNRAAIVIEQGILEITEPDTVFIKLKKKIEKRNLISVRSLKDLDSLLILIYNKH